MAAGEFSPRERHELDRVIRAAEQASRREFSVFVGTADGDPTAFARRLHASLVAPAVSVLVMVDPEQRAVEVVTGSDVRRHLSDGEVDLAVLHMKAAFAEGDLVGGLKRGVAMLADHARAPETLHQG